jgi:hypothetical protein
MTEEAIDTQDAPVLGESTDVDPVVTSVDVSGSDHPEAGAEQTMDTPDELGGTGGGQAGGAG